MAFRPHRETPANRKHTSASAASPSGGRDFQKFAMVALGIALLIATAFAFVGAARAEQTAAVTARGGLFRTVEIRRSSVHLLGKWARLLHRARLERRRTVRCSAGRRADCALKRWKAHLQTLRGAGAMAQLRAVNRYINRWRYVDDRDNYGKVDHWATPRQMFARGGGDCEDYAIAKYMSLKALGWSVNKLRLVVVMDQNLRIAHAVLSVRVGRTFYILDNQIKSVVDHRRIRHYRPIYSMNERHWWFHKKRRIRVAQRS